LSPNLKAFLDTIAVSEIGRELLAVSDDGYNVIVGSTAAKPDLFDSYATHPHKARTLTIRGKQVISTAAGRYQILGRYADVYIKQLFLPDFGHDSQDKIAVQLIQECDAMRAIEKGDIATALFKCRSRWASLPSAGYDQHENTLADLMQAYTEAGGSVA